MYPAHGSIAGGIAASASGRRNSAFPSVLRIIDACRASGARDSRIVTAVHRQAPLPGPVSIIEAFAPSAEVHTASARTMVDAAWMKMLEVHVQATCWRRNLGFVYLFHPRKSAMGIGCQFVSVTPLGRIHVSTGFDAPERHLPWDFRSNLDAVSRGERLSWSRNHSLPMEFVEPPRDDR